MPRAGIDGKPRHAQRRGQRLHARQPEADGREAFDRRFRYGVLEPELPEAFPHRRAQDRSVLRARRHDRSRRRHHRQSDHRAGARTQPESDRGRGGDQGAHRFPSRAPLRPGPGFLLQQAASLSRIRSAATRKIPHGTNRQARPLHFDFSRRTKKMSETAKPKAKRAERRERAKAVPAQGGNRLPHRIRELERILRQHVSLRKLSSYLKASLTAAEAYAAVECFGPQLFQGATGKLYLIHPPGDYLEHVATWGEASPSEGTFPFRDCWALRRAQPHWVRDTRAEPLCGHVAPVSKSVLPYLCVPLIPQGKLHGLLHVRRLKIESSPSKNIGSMESSLNLASNVAEEIGLALANLNLRETLHEQSIRDPLTGLYNRRFLEDS